MQDAQSALVFRLAEVIGDRLWSLIVRDFECIIVSFCFCLRVIMGANINEIFTDYEERVRRLPHVPAHGLFMTLFLVLKPAPCDL
jgi:hypothetical protein